MSADVAIVRTRRNQNPRTALLRSTSRSCHKDPKRRWYAVSQGRIVGVFREWEACRNSVHGFSNAHYRAFWSQKTASNWLAYHLSQWPVPVYDGGSTVPSNATTSSPPPADSSDAWPTVYGYDAVCSGVLDDGDAESFQSTPTWAEDLGEVSSPPSLSSSPPSSLFLRQLEGLASPRWPAHVETYDEVQYKSRDEEMSHDITDAFSYSTLLPSEAIEAVAKSASCSSSSSFEPKHSAYLESSVSDPTADTRPDMNQSSERCDSVDRTAPIQALVDERAGQTPAPLVTNARAILHAQHISKWSRLPTDRIVWYDRQTYQVLRDGCLLHLARCLTCYTSACVLGEDAEARAAGYGIYFGKHHPLNLAMPVHHDCAHPLTSHRTELYAILHVIRLVHMDQTLLRIHTRSHYSMRAIKKCYADLRGVGPGTRNATQHINQRWCDLGTQPNSDLIATIAISMYRRAERHGQHCVRLIKVPLERDMRGDMAAHRLARTAAHLDQAIHTPTLP